MARKSLTEMYNFIKTMMWDSQLDDALFTQPNIKEKYNIVHQRFFKDIQRMDLKFGRKHSAVINLVANNEFISAPADFDCLEMMEYKASSSPEIWDEMDEIESWERDKYYGGTGLIASRSGKVKYGFYHAGINNTTPTAPVYRFGILPIPTVAETGTIRLFYQWTPPVMGDNDLILIPEDWTLYSALETMAVLGVKDETVIGDTYFAKMLMREERRCMDKYQSVSKKPLRIERRKFRFR